MSHTEETLRFLFLVTQGFRAYPKLCKGVWVICQTEGVKVVASWVKAVEALVAFDTSLESVSLNGSHQDDLQDHQCSLLDAPNSPTHVLSSVIGGITPQFCCKAHSCDVTHHRL